MKEHRKITGGAMISICVKVASLAINSENPALNLQHADTVYLADRKGNQPIKNLTNNTHVIFFWNRSQQKVGSVRFQQ